MTLQRTFGPDFGLATKVPVAPHNDDERICDECGEQIDLADWNSSTDCCNDCTENEFTECDECGEWVGNDDIRTSEARRDCRELCESCYDDEHTTCTGCADSVHNDESVTSECGDEWCEDCYNDAFTTCDGCNCEIYREGYEYHVTDDGECYCNGCYDEHYCEEWDQNMRWSGCAAYDKIGSPRKFGVELETSDSPDYQDWARNTDWGAKEDGSIRGKEFVSPPMHGNDGYDSVIEFCRRMERNGCDVDDSCGYHLHIDLSDTSKEQRKVIALAYHYTREFWAGCIDSERRDTYYARYSCNSKHGYGDDWDRDKIMGGDDKPRARDRYVWLNWASFDRHSTVEVRSHEGTCDGRAVINWVKAHTKFVDYVKGMTCGQVTRVFGNESPSAIMREMRFVWDDAGLSDYYARKGGWE